MRGFRVFSIGDIPVAVDLFYVLLLLFWMQSGVVYGLLWGGCVTVSILVHELGHAVVAKRYRLHPHILLWGLGGLCFHDRAERDRHDALITAAGPAAGLLLGVLVWAGSFALPALTSAEQTGLALAHQAVSMLLFVNILWSFVNLLPLWPLDGGQLFRLGLIQFLRPTLAERITHIVSLVLVALALLYAWLSSEMFIALLAGFAGWQNIRALRGDISSGPYRATSKQAIELLARAKKTYADGDYAETARLCHQLRSLDNPTEATMREAWALLGASSARLGRHEEALTYLDRAPLTPDVVEAKIECLFQLDRDAELDTLLSSRAFQKIPAARREEILALVKS
jgi:Zn-dependent protease